MINLLLILLCNELCHIHNVGILFFYLKNWMYLLVIFCSNQTFGCHLHQSTWKKMSHCNQDNPKFIAGLKAAVKHSFHLIIYICTEICARQIKVVVLNHSLVQLFTQITGLVLILLMCKWKSLFINIVEWNFSEFRALSTFGNL